MPTIGIIGFKTDPHVQLLVKEIERQRARAVIVDFYNFPRFNLLSIDEAASYDDIHIDETVRFPSIDLLFLRNFAYPFPANASNRLRFIEHSAGVRNNLVLQYSVVRMLEDRIPVINNLDSTLLHRLKSYQHFLLNAHGISVPQTLSTNNVEEIEAFLGKFPQGVIVKPGTSGAEVVMADREFFENNQEILKTRPFVFQQYVKGRSLRAYSLGGRAISIGEIIYDKRVVDWREKEIGVEPYEVKEALRAEIARAVKILNLVFCSIDIEYDTLTKKYYLLDFSPAPLFTGWSKTTKTNIAGEIADYLFRVLDNNGIIWNES